MMRLKLKTAPAVEPVSLTEAKAQLRVDGTDEDALITLQIEAARDYIEQQTSRALITQTWYAYLDQFPTERGFFYLPKAPIGAVSSIKYLDTNGVLQTWSAAEYVVDAQTTTPARVSLAYNASWPTTQVQANSVVIEYTCGYGATAASVPVGLRQAMLMTIGHWYENREAVALGTIATTVPASARALIDMHAVLEAPVYTEEV